MKITFRALSVVEPAGALIRAGRKTIEVRDWQPDILPLRDLLIIQNAKKLSSSGLSHDPEGMAIALVDVIGVRAWTAEDLSASCSDKFAEGWLAWELRNIRPVDYPDVVSARLRIYEVELEAKSLKTQQSSS